MSDKIRYHYQGKILEADHWVTAGHALKITDPEHPGRFHYVWPEQVIKNGVPAVDPYGMNLKGPTLHPEQFGSERRERQPRAARQDSGPKTAAEGGDISLADVCKELAVEPSLARRILRKHWTKPDGGWSFTPQQAEDVKKILVSEIKGK